jgi:hypothetical protein
MVCITKYVVTSILYNVVNIYINNNDVYDLCCAVMNIYGYVI